MGETNRPSIPLRSPDSPIDDIDLNAIASQLFAIAERLRGERSGFDWVEPHSLSRGEAVSQRGSLHIDDSTGKPPELAKELAKRSAGQCLEFARLAKQAYALRRQRETIFANSELFGEPAWDILLDLYVAHVDGKRVSVSSACIGSASPPTTGLRWLGVLADEGLIVREHDPEDQRRVLVRLSETGVEAMNTYFDSAASGS